MTQSHIKKVVVVGAGPVGFLPDLMLGQRGINVDLLEAGGEVNGSPRGLAYGPAAVRVLHRAGVLARVIERGFESRSVAWREFGGRMIIGVDRRGVGQDAGKAWVEVEDASIGIKTMEADFILGCDGGTCAVRKALFGASFPGYTWPMHNISTNVSIDLDKFDLSDAQWFVHPEHWFVIVRMGERRLWRIGYGETPGLSMAEMCARLIEKFCKYLPGHPEPEEYTVHSFTPYAVHQRCAEKMRVGRILLAGDAAHLNNPIGGLGLTTGIAEVGSLIDCLYGIHDGLASLHILDKYDEVRRQIFLNHVDVISTANFKRIMQDPEGIAARDPFFQLLTRARQDLEIAASLAEAELSIGCDMTQYYTTT